VRSGSALLKYSGTSADVVKELESAKALMHVEARFLSSDEFAEVPCVSGLRWFVKHDKNDFQLVVGNATTPSARVAVAFFDEDAAAISIGTWRASFTNSHN
jgi:hypothetical protein